MTCMTLAPDPGPDRIAWARLSSITLPLSTPISDAKVFTGRQKPMTEVVFLFAEIQTENGFEGIGSFIGKGAFLRLFRFGRL